MRGTMGVALLIGVVIFLSGSFQAGAGEAAKTVNITGELIDTYCYSTMGAKGPGHRQCAIECAQKGIPVGLLEDKSNKVYVLLPNKDKSPLPKEVVDKMAQKVTITGKTYAMGGTQFLTVETIK